MTLLLFYFQNLGKVNEISISLSSPCVPTAGRKCSQTNATVAMATNVELPWKGSHSLDNAAAT